MRSVTETTMVMTSVKSHAPDKRGRSVKRWSFLMMTSGILGVFCGVTGLMINVLFLFGVAENKGLMGILSLWLLVLAFPMLWCTSHCLDRVDKIDRAIRLDYCEKHGLEIQGRDTLHTDRD